MKTIDYLNKKKELYLTYLAEMKSGDYQSALKYYTNELTELNECIEELDALGHLLSMCAHDLAIDGANTKTSVKNVLNVALREMFGEGGNEIILYKYFAK